MIAFPNLIGAFSTIVLAALAFSIVVAVLVGLVSFVITLVKLVDRGVGSTVDRTMIDPESVAVGPTITAPGGVSPVITMGELPRPSAEPDQ